MLIPFIVAAAAATFSPATQSNGIVGASSGTTNPIPDLKKINIQNSTNLTIFKVFAWPTALNQRTFNLLYLPILSRQEGNISIDNEYSDCDITFQVDVNDPAQRKNRRYKRNSYIFARQDICKNGTDVEIHQPQ